MSERNLFVCNVCKTPVAYASKFSLKRHHQKYHVGNCDMSSPRTKNCSLDCGFKFSKFSEFSEHLTNDHGIEMITELHTFSSNEELYAWKEKEEQENNVNFVSHTARKRLRDGERMYMRCSRSGEKRLKTENRLRSTKVQGSIKIGGICPARIIVLWKEKSIEVEYHKTHVGHDKDLAYMKLTKRQRTRIAEKIQSGLSFDMILDEVRGTSGELSKVNVITRKDLRNIARDNKLVAAPNVPSVESHTNDTTSSINIWLEKVQELGDNNPVLLYKKKETVCPFSLLGWNDFMLIIMTPYQKSCFEQFGFDRLCVDSTCRATIASYTLTTILLIDEFSMVIPAAFCISNRLDEYVMTAFFRALQQKIGEVRCSVFMSDDLPFYINAWQAVMGPPDQVLLSTWHVDKDFKASVWKVRGSKGTKVEVYKLCRLLLEETDEQSCKELLPSVLTVFDESPETRDFGIYFRENYIPRIEQWSYCYRSNLGLTTNMRLEAMNLLLKRTYSRSLKTKNVDLFIFQLLKLVRDKAFDRLNRLIKGDSKGMLHKLKCRHKASLSIPVDHVNPIGDASWEVVDNRHSDLKYLVKRSEVLDCLCKLACDSCSGCVHMYECTCIDFTINCNMCKHIHAVIRTEKRQMKLKSDDLNKSYDIPVNDEELNYLELKSVDCTSGNPGISGVSGVCNSDSFTFSEASQTISFSVSDSSSSKKHAVLNKLEFLFNLISQNELESNVLGRFDAYLDLMVSHVINQRYNCVEVVKVVSDEMESDKQSDSYILQEVKNEALCKQKGQISDDPITDNYTLVRLRDVDHNYSFLSNN